MTAAGLWPELRPEHRLLLGLCRLNIEPAQREAVAVVMAEHADGIDWGAFVDQACRHRVLPLVSRNFERYGLHRGGDGRIAVPYWWLFEGSVRANRERNLVLAAEYGKVVDALNDAGVRYAVRKGAALGERLYPDPALRITRDLDVLIAPDDRVRAAEALARLGYAPGTPSSDGSTVAPFSRQTQAFWRTYLATEPPLHRAAGYAGLDWYVVDLTTSLLHSGGRRVDSTELLASAPTARLYGRLGRVLPWPDWLVNLAVHLYEESVSVHHIKRGKDLRLQKFVDIAAVCGVAGGADEWRTFTARGAEYGVGAETYHALFHTERLFPGTVPAWVLDELRPGDTTYLDQYGQLDGAPHRWDDPFLRRLFDPRRARRVHARSRIPMG